MKILNKKLLLIITLSLLSSCGLMNAHYTMGYNLYKGFAPHPYKVKRVGDNAFPENGMGVVDLNVKVGGQRVEQVDVGTSWRRINDDGTFSDRKSLTYFTYFKNGRTESMLEPGTYFLDGLRYLHNDKSIKIGTFTNLMKSDKQYGWDIANNEPLWFSFTLEKGKELYLPDISVFVSCKYGFNVCEGDNLIFHIKVAKSSDAKKVNSYKFGRDIEKMERDS